MGHCVGSGLWRRGYCGIAGKVKQVSKLKKPQKKSRFGWWHRKTARGGGGKGKEAGHYSGLSMRTKRLKFPLVACATTNLLEMRRCGHSPFNTHDQPHFCINNVTKITEVLSPASHQYWLQGKDDNVNGFMLNYGMAWTKPEYPHFQVDKAGQIFASESADNLLKIDDALMVINNWRSSHGCPLQSIKMTLLGRAQKIDIDALIAQRIKRLRAIRVKLLRGQNKNMKLSKMHDIGGCRAVLRSVSQVEELVNVYEKATAKNKFRGGEFVKKYDYISLAANNE